MSTSAQDFLEMLSEKYLNDKVTINKLWASMVAEARSDISIFAERLRRAVKYEEVYLKQYETVPTLFRSLDHYFTFYNQERPHQSLWCQTPALVYGQVRLPA